MGLWDRKRLNKVILEAIEANKEFTADQILDEMEVIISELRVKSAIHDIHDSSVAAVDLMLCVADPQIRRDWVKFVEVSNGLR